MKRSVASAFAAGCCFHDAMRSVNSAPGRLSHVQRVGDVRVAFDLRGSESGHVAAIDRVTAPAQQPRQRHLRAGPPERVAQADICDTRAAGGCCVPGARTHFFLPAWLAATPGSSRRAAALADERVGLVSADEIEFRCTSAHRRTWLGQTCDRPSHGRVIQCTRALRAAPKWNPMGNLSIALMDAMPRSIHPALRKAGTRWLSSCAEGR
jgi:hypothetical protein